MVEVPVIPKTVHINTISTYQRGVFLGGMGLGLRNLCRKLLDGLLLLLLFFGEVVVNDFAADGKGRGDEGPGREGGSLRLLPFHRQCCCRHQEEEGDDDDVVEMRDFKPFLACGCTAMRRVAACLAKADVLAPLKYFIVDRIVEQLPPLRRRGGEEKEERRGGSAMMRRNNSNINYRQRVLTKDFNIVKNWRELNLGGVAGWFT